MDRSSTGPFRPGQEKTKMKLYHLFGGPERVHLERHDRKLVRCAEIASKFEKPLMPPHTLVSWGFLRSHSAEQNRADHDRASHRRARHPHKHRERLRDTGGLRGNAGSVIAS